MPRLRRVAYSLLVTVVVLAALDGVAAWVEPRLTPPAASVPTPAPGKLDPTFQERQARARGQVPLVPVRDEVGTWGLEPAATHREGALLVRVNSLGLRGPELGEKAAGEVRLYTLGDSSVYGLGVPEAAVFSTVAAERLAAAWGRPVSPVIGGVPGYDSSQALDQLGRVGAAVAPDFVVVAAMWSDLYRVDKVAWKDDERLVAARQWALWRVGRVLLAPWLLARKVTWAEHADDIGAADDARVSLPRYVRNLDAIAAEAARLGARPVFLALAAPMDLDVAPVPETVQAYRLAMRRAAERAGAPFVDGPAWFREHGATIGYFTDQVHPAAEGHLLLGEALAAALSPLPPP